MPQKWFGPDPWTGWKLTTMPNRLVHSSYTDRSSALPGGPLGGGGSSIPVSDH